MNFVSWIILLVELLPQCFGYRMRKSASERAVDLLELGIASECAGALPVEKTKYLKILCIY